jgi:RNA polymerase sigma-70 factor (ECF subfamily)
MDSAISLEEERELVERAKVDAEAFGRLYDLYYQKIFGYIMHRVANVEVAQDVTSETFFKALKSLQSFHWRNISFSSWIFRIATNEITNYYRKNKHYVSVDIEDLSQHASNAEDVREEMMQAEDALQRSQDFVKMQVLMSELPDKYQEVLSLRFFEDKQITEIAEILGKKEGTVKSLLHRGIEKLRVHMEADATQT